MNQLTMSRRTNFFTWIVSIGFSFVITQGLTQHHRILRSTLGSGGSTSNVTLQGSSYLVQQSIGQGSVTGIVQPLQIQLRQGFIQPHGFASFTGIEPAVATIFPNPFSSQLAIQLNDGSPGQLRITLSDILGRVVYTIAPEAQQTIFVEPGALVSGYYIIRIYSGKKIYTSKIIKE
jgi:Secretion system C-terminal sorting domain